MWRDQVSRREGGREESCSDEVICEREEGFSPGMGNPGKGSVPRDLGKGRGGGGGRGKRPQPDGSKSRGGGAWGSEPMCGGPKMGGPFAPGQTP